jgi:hypothetical protein
MSKVNLDTTTRGIGLGDAGEIMVDVDKLAAHDAVVNYIFNYGLKQMLNDVHASVTAKAEPNADKRKEAKLALSLKKLDSLYKGEVAQARATSAGDKLTREMRLVATEIVKDKLRAIGKPWGKLSKGVQKSVVDKYLATYADDVRKAAQARIDATKGDASVELDLAELGL